MAGRIKELIFKPKWQHKDARIRAAAVARSEDERLLALLPELAREDPDPAVRLAAARRVPDLDLMRALMADGDGRVRELAQRVFRQLLLGEHAEAPPVERRLAVFGEFDDADLIEAVARSADDVALRTAAVRRIDRQGLLGDLAIDDPEPSIRLEAASRIEQASTLDRVARAVRTRDKRVFREVNERLRAQQVESGDTEAVADQALELCEMAEALTRSDERLEHRQQTVATLRAQWQALHLPPDHDLQRRFEGACRVIELAASGAIASPEAQRTGQAEGALEAFLRTAPSEARPTQDLAALEAHLQHGENLRHQHRDHLDGGHQAQLEDRLAFLTAERERLLAEQPADASLTRIRRKLERLSPPRIDTAGLERMQSDWDRAWSALTHPNPGDHSEKTRFLALLRNKREEMETAHQRRETALGEIEPHMQALEQALDDGDLSLAAKAKQRVLDDLEAIGRHPRVRDPEFQARVAGGRRRLHELRDWQHWANNEVRARLCQHAEEIPGSGLHPDAVTARLKELRARWKALDESERLPGDAPNRRPNPALWRRFQAACNRAFKPAKPYFAKRAELQESKLDELAALCDQLTAEATAEAPIREQERLMATARRSLRELAAIPPARRKKMARALREGADAIEARLAPEYEIIERRKQRLIDEVQALAEEPDLDRAIEAAKQAQGRWKDAGSTHRRQEQKLWKAFRRACDAVFDRLQAQREGDRQARREQLDALNGLIEEVRGLLALDGDDLERAPESLPRLRSAWREVGVKDRRLEQTFEGLCNDVENAARRAQGRHARRLREMVRERDRLCRRAERLALAGKSDELGKLDAEWSELPSESGTEALEARYRRAVEGDPAALAKDAEQQREAAEDLCIRAEFLAGVESPAECQDQRMAYQVKRLSDRMGGGKAVAATEEARQLEARWQGVGPLPQEGGEALEHRFLAALEHFENTDH